MNVKSITAQTVPPEDQSERSGKTVMTKKTILIVGGSSGIGLELAKDLIVSGDDVVVTSRSRDTAERTADGSDQSAL